MLFLPLTTVVAEEDTTPAESAITSTPADNETAALTLDDVLAGRATAEEVFGTFTEDVVPDIVGFESAVNSGHVARLYEEEGDDLNNVIFLNKDGTQSISSTRTYSWDLSNMKLIVLVSCSTGAGGEGGLNLPTQMVEDGAETVVAFKTTIACESANQWTIRFFALLSQGKTVQAACNQLATELATTPGCSDTGLDSVVVFGNKSLTLT